MEKRKYHIGGMFCAACVARVEKAISGAPGVSKAEVSLLANSAEVTFEDRHDDDAVLSAVKGAGYSASLDLGESVYERRGKRKKKLLFDLSRVIVAFVLSALTMYFSMTHMMGWPGINITVDLTLAMVFAFATMALYADYFYHGLKALFRLSPDMLSLVSLGSLISFAYSVYLYVETVWGGTMNHSYFDSASMILFFVSLGKLLESLAKAQSTSSLEALLALMPEKAVLLEGKNQREVDASSLKVGDIVLVKPGSKVPADGVVAEGYGNIEEAALTGEAAPIFKNVGDEVKGGSMNLTGSFKMEVKAAGNETSLSKMAQMVEAAASSKGKLAAIADRVSMYFVPAIILIAIITFIVWMSIGTGFDTAIGYAVTTLVVACPCALGLATPVAVMVGASRASSMGILFKEARSFESLGKIDTMLIDKTGTLTSGHLSIERAPSLNNDELNLLYTLESKSEHPLAWSIALYLKEKGGESLGCDDFENIPGEGIKGTVDGRKVGIGNRKLMEAMDCHDFDAESKIYEDKGYLVTYYCIDGKIRGFFASTDSIKEGAKETVDEIQRAGVSLVLASGDTVQRAAELCSKVGISSYHAGIKPEGKISLVESLKKDGHHVAMVGDGVNDAPALKCSDVGIGIGTGTDLALDSADVILRDGSLEKLSAAYFLSKRVVFNIKMNLFWAFAYNVVLIPVAAGIFSTLGFSINPMWASLAMALSSIFVVLNALTLKIVPLKR